MPKNECKDCSKRYLGCHSKCESYMAYRKAKDERNYRDWVEGKECAEVKRVRRKNILSTHMR